MYGLVIGDFADCSLKNEVVKKIPSFVKILKKSR